MNPGIIIYGFLTFLICLIFHVFIWRIRIPKNDASALFLIFLIIPSSIFLILLSIRMLDFIIALSAIEMAYILLLHISLSFIYISSYPAAQAVSPSLDIILIIASAETKRLTEGDIIKNYKDAHIIKNRISDLMASALIKQKGECFELSPIGRFTIIFFILYRKILGLAAGKG